MSETATPELITVRTEGRVGVITLNRPKQLNALNDQLMTELGAALQAFDADEGIGCMIITGSEKAFAAGADIGAMATYTFADVYKGDYITRNWETIRSVRKPVIAAVSGFALGGGCELAMMCDFIIAADNAKFGQPEIKIGIIPGAGGTQRLPRAMGKSKAMDLVLTGRMMDAAEAERGGLVSRVVPLDKLMDEALGAALMICGYGQLATMAFGVTDTIVLGDLSAGLALMQNRQTVAILQSAIIPFGWIGRTLYRWTNRRRYARGNSSFVIYHPAECHFIAERFKALLEQNPKFEFRPMVADERFISWVAQEHMLVIVAQALWWCPILLEQLRGSKNSLNFCPPMLTNWHQSQRPMTLTIGSHLKLVLSFQKPPLVATTSVT